MASFFDDERLQRLFSFQSMYAGLAPYEALALYAVITYMDTVEGVYVPEGGMHAWRRAWPRPPRRRASTSATTPTSTRILRDGDRRGHRRRLAGGERVAADAVVCNPDLPVAYRTLLGGVDAPRAARRGRYSPSCVLWLAGVRGLPPAGAAHHNIHFGRAVGRAFRALLDDGELMPDPSILVTLHSLDDPSLAPAGCSTLYVLEPVPNLDGRVDWTSAASAAVDRLRRRVAALGYPTDVEVEEIYDPLDWEARAWSGARRSRWPTRSARPARSARATSTAVCPGWCSSARARCPASACPWCSCPGAGRRAGGGESRRHGGVPMSGHASRWRQSYAECRR